MKLSFSNWDWQPAVRAPGGPSFAVLEPGGPWVEVDDKDVAESGRLMSEEAWRKTFGVLPPLPPALAKCDRTA